MSNRVSRAEQAAIDRIIRNTGSDAVPPSSIVTGNVVTPTTTSSAGAGARAGGDAAGGADPSMSQTVANIEQIQQNNVEKLRNALRYSNQSNELADDTVTHLGRQRETIERSVAVSEDTSGILAMTKRTIKDLQCGIFKEKLFKTSVIAALLLIIVLIIYFKFLKRTR